MFRDINNNRNFNNNYPRNDRGNRNNERGYNNRNNDRNYSDRDYSERDNSENNLEDNKEEENIIIPEYVYDSELYEFKSWDDSGLDMNILKGIYAYGFESPSAIQQKAIKPIILGKDIIAQAQSGTGKTATFSIGALSLINVKDNFTQVLILSPTRELTIQTANVIRSIGSQIEGLRVMQLFGGSSIDETSEALK